MTARPSGDPPEFWHAHLAQASPVLIETPTGRATLLVGCGRVPLGAGLEAICLLRSA